MDLKNIFGPIANIEASHQNDIEEVYFDVVGTLEVRGKPTGLQDFLLWLEDKGAKVGIFSSDPAEAREALVRAGSNPRILRKEIEQKHLVLQEASDGHRSIAVVDDDTLPAILCDVPCVIDAKDRRTITFITTQAYKKLTP